MPDGLMSVCTMPVDIRGMKALAPSMPGVLGCSMPGCNTPGRLMDGPPGITRSKRCWKPSGRTFLSATRLILTALPSGVNLRVSILPSGVLYILFIPGGLPGDLLVLGVVGALRGLRPGLFLGVPLALTLFRPRPAAANLRFLQDSRAYGRMRIFCLYVDRHSMAPIFTLSHWCLALPNSSVISITHRGSTCSCSSGGLENPRCFVNVTTCNIPTHHYQTGTSPSR